MLEIPSDDRGTDEPADDSWSDDIDGDDSWSDCDDSAKLFGVYGDLIVKLLLSGNIYALLFDWLLLLPFLLNRITKTIKAIKNNTKRIIKS